jgi:NADPH:quinone reductase
MSASSNLALPAFPWVSGAEFAGVVLATPAKSSKPRFPVGSRVFGASQGAYATKVTAKELQLLPVPEGWSFQEAAGLFVTAPTSYGALVIRAGVKSGDYVLVHAAAGGVGLAAVQGQLRSLTYLAARVTVKPVLTICH